MLRLCPSEGQQQWHPTSQRQKCVTSHRIPFNPEIRGDRVPDYTEICLRSGTGLFLIKPPTASLSWYELCVSNVLLHKLSNIDVLDRTELALTRWNVTSFADKSITAGQSCCQMLNRFDSHWAHQMYRDCSAWALKAGSNLSWGDVWVISDTEDRHCVFVITEFSYRPHASFFLSKLVGKTLSRHVKKTLFWFCFSLPHVTSP